MQEAMRTYLELAMGLTDTSRKQVKKVVKEAVGRSGATADQVRALTADLLATNSANRDALSKLVRFEVDRALGMVGLATAEEVGELTSRVRDLERQLAEAKSAPSTPGAEPVAAAAPGARTRTTAKATKAAATKTTAAKTTAAKATAPATKATAPATKATKATKAAPRKTTKAAATKATKASTAKATATKATATKATATKATPRKPAPRKAAQSKATGVGA